MINLEKSLMIYLLNIATSYFKDLFMSKRILVLDELQSIYLSACNHHYICSSFVKEWIDFQYRATTEGVSQFDIDQYILSDDQFESKYKGT